MKTLTVTPREPTGGLTAAAIVLVGLLVLISGGLSSLVYQYLIVPLIGSPFYSWIYELTDLTFSLLIPLLLFFWCGVLVGVDPFRQRLSVVLPALASGLVIAILGPTLRYEFGFALEFPSNSASFGSIVWTSLVGLTNPMGLLYGLGSAIFFVMLALTGISFAYFWRQTDHRSFRNWLEKEDEPEEEEPGVQPEPA